MERGSNFMFSIILRLLGRISSGERGSLITFLSELNYLIFKLQKGLKEYADLMDSNYFKSGKLNRLSDRIPKLAGYNLKELTLI